MYCSPEGLQKKKERGKKEKTQQTKPPHFSIGGQEKKWERCSILRLLAQLPEAYLQDKKRNMTCSVYSEIQETSLKVVLNALFFSELQRPFQSFQQGSISQVILSVHVCIYDS